MNGLSVVVQIILSRGVMVQSSDLDAHRIVGVRILDEQEYSIDFFRIPFLWKNSNLYCNFRF